MKTLLPCLPRTGGHGPNLAAMPQEAAEAARVRDLVAADRLDEALALARD